MTDSTIQQLYDLGPEDLSYAICTLAFGKPEDTVAVAEENFPLEAMRILYKSSRVAMYTKMVVKTYDNNHQENGSALVLKQHTHYDEKFCGQSYKIHDEVELIVVVAGDYYVDIKQFEVKSLFLPDRHNLYVHTANSIKFFSQDYGKVNFYQNMTLEEVWQQPFLWSLVDGIPMDLKLTNCRLSRNAQPQEQKPLELNYIKASETAYIEIWSETEPQSASHPSEMPGIIFSSSLRIVFFPLKDGADALLFEGKKP